IRRSSDVYFAAMGDKASIQAPIIAAKLRADVPGLRIIVHAGGGNFKKQLKRADKSDALVALIIGEDELEQGVVTVKYLRERKEQVTLELEQVKTLLAELV
ncbi:His/Gly/Thr/Pro-type tRNA ligase C-terminal domain-containing protein, partial [Pseudoalteromonas sp.]